MKKIIKRTMNFFSEAEHIRKMEAELETIEAELVAQKEAANALENQEMDDALKNLAHFTGRLVLVTNFGGMAAFDRGLFSTELARMISTQVPSSEISLGISAHASSRRLKMELGENPFERAADELEQTLAETGYRTYRTDGPPFKDGLGINSISKAIERTVDYYNMPIGEIGHIAVVSALPMSEVGLGYPEAGRGFVLQEISEGVGGKEFTWTKLDPLDQFRTL